jgi:hypothetical protein
MQQNGNGTNWFTCVEGGYEIRVLPRAESQSGAARSGDFGYAVKILPPGADASVADGWVELSSGKEARYPTECEACDAGVAAARKRIMAAFGEPDVRLD